MRTNKKWKTDPELLRQLKLAGSSTRSIEAIFSLDLPLHMLAPNNVEAAANRVLGRVENDVGYKPGCVNMFKNLGSFAVFADATFIQKIIDDPEIGSAIANSRPGWSIV